MGALAVSAPGGGRRPGATDVGLAILRVGLATVFAVQGYLKLFGGRYDATVALFMTVGIPAPELTVRLVGGAEMVGALLVAAGLATRLGAAALAVVMVGAIAWVRWPRGFVGGWEFEFMLLAAALASTAAGAGRISLGEVLRGRAAARGRKRTQVGQ